MLTQVHSLHGGQFELELTADGTSVVDVKLFRFWNGTDRDLFIKGRVKWDGCADLEFVDVDSPLVHVCGTDGWQDITVAVWQMLRIASEEAQRSVRGEP
jgi:hypothetical protein